MLKITNRFLALAVAFVGIHYIAVCILNCLFTIKKECQEQSLVKRLLILWKNLSELCEMLCLCGVGEEDKMLHFTKLFSRHAVACLEKSYFRLCHLEGGTFSTNMNS